MPCGDLLSKNVDEINPARCDLSPRTIDIVKFGSNAELDVMRSLVRADVHIEYDRVSPDTALLLL